MDVGSVQACAELHCLIAKTFGFPEYYGNNWDAFNECIRDFLPVGIIRITGIRHLDNTLPRESELLRRCFQAFEAELPQRRKVHVS